jgi:hypothetical protein
MNLRREPGKRQARKQAPSARLLRQDFFKRRTKHDCVRLVLSLFAVREMSQVIFPNGNGTFISSALTPDSVATVLQNVTANILGYDYTQNPQQAYNAVRVAWQQSGQPAWGITDDVCIVRAYSLDEPYSKVRDQLIASNDSVSVMDKMSFTQVWNVHFTLYGPNAYDHARLISSAMSLDWVAFLLAQSNLYPIVSWERPQYIPELFQGQWWKRADLDLRFNELVLESLAIPSALSAQITLITDTGLTETITV